ncbi:MAG: SsrA-binding protein SmpB [Sutterella sp.]|uniref:SsrA-binding protein n=1 Tax=Mesosutterella multiformis TaxID=2259133 RepID=A0A388SB93_9BURK|nr:MULTISPECIES: SsrA-binding protein SmpB [Sutterellaceae]MBS5810900.1 SsrA-binding protein SmpB [Sutterella sp.]MCH3935280.1 SsrA-binding protein SmpB [Mesosutterella sp.]MBM6984308.1 SsrA-binding protein SmpB [Mesosutterella multiformis]MBS6156673.1 SsrA-binding protein SmpB [Sutterella sp.]MCH3936133.1 SsrA-binding protein SmpB [Mesosutterella sp.]
MPSDNPHIVNRKAHFNYAIEEKFECGLVLKGWEVKSVRAGRVQIGDSHVYEYGGELWLSNAHMNPTDEISTHERANPTRTRKVLMHRREIMRLIGRVERQGYSLIPLDLHFSRGRVKMTLALAKGKREFEKRADESKKQWERDRQRLMKTRTRG